MADSLFKMERKLQSPAWKVCVCVCSREKESTRERPSTQTWPPPLLLSFLIHHVIFSSGLKVMQMASQRSTLHISLSDTKGCSSASGWTRTGGSKISIQLKLSWKRFLRSCCVTDVNTRQAWSENCPRIWSKLLYIPVASEGNAQGFNEAF